MVLSLQAVCGKWQAMLFLSGKEVNRLYFTVTAGTFDLSLITLDGYRQGMSFSQLFIRKSLVSSNYRKQKGNPRYGKHWVQEDISV